MLLRDSLPERVGGGYRGGSNRYRVEERAPDQILELFEFYALMIF